MENKKELTIEDLTEALGGTISESASLIIPIAARGYKLCLKPNEDPDRHDIVDIEGLQEFFASKGYKFIPGFGEEQNVFIGPDGNRYGNDYIIHLLDNGLL